MLQRATATFFIGEAKTGNRLGKVVYKNERIEKTQLYRSLKPSSRLNSGLRQSTATIKQKLNHDLEEDTGENQNQKCIMCHILQDQSLKRTSGLLLKKLQHFVKDMILFRTKSLSQAERDISKLVRKYPREPAFQFSLTEMTHYKALAEQLDPKENYGKSFMKQEATMDYLEHHICQETAQLVTPPIEFGFKFNWNVDGGATFEDGQMYDSAYGDVQSESQWNFSNLGR